MPTKKVTMLVNAKDVIGHINPEIYGHFSEHLGRCIYDGIYVGRIRGYLISTEYVRILLMPSGISRFRFSDGRGDVLRMSTTGRMV